MMLNSFRKIVLVALTICTVSAVYWYTNRDVAPRDVAWQDIEMEAQQGGYKIIRTDDLWDIYQKSQQSLLLIDTRQEWEYRMGHMAGALNFPMEPTWLSRWRNKNALLSILGADKDRLIVFY